MKKIFFIEKNLNFYLISKQNNFFNLYLIKTIKNLISFEFLKIDLNLDKNTIINFLFKRYKYSNAHSDLSKNYKYLSKALNYFYLKKIKIYFYKNFLLNL